MSRVLRFADWTIGPERDGGGRVASAMREMWCTACEEMSEASPEQGVTDHWALGHAGQAGHFTFREVTTAPLVVQPAPTNPLYGQEGER